MKMDEVPKLKVSVSLLLNFTDIQDPWGFEIGRHGVEIEFVYRGRRYSSTFLPEVAPEQKWNQQDVIANLINKSGYQAEDCYAAAQLLASSMKVTTYESSKLSMTYEAFQQFIA